MATQATDLTQEILKRADIIGAYAANSIEKITDYTTKFGNAAYDEVVALAQQYVMFGVVYHVTTMLLALILTIATITIFVKNLKQVSSRNADGTQKHFSEAEQTKFTIYMMTSVITAVVCVFYMMTNFKETVLVCVAPKIWLLQEVTHMVQAYK